MNKFITIHCAATPDDTKHDFDITDIDSWHKERGFKRSPQWGSKVRPELGHIGYHFVIKRSGEVQLGRDTAETGAHVAGHNTDNIGICMIGSKKFSKLQWDALKLLVADLMSAFPIVAVKGHRDWPDVKKDCPGFDVASWFVDKTPDDRNIL